jgi:hypothetical protein
MGAEIQFGAEDSFAKATLVVLGLLVNANRMSTSTDNARVQRVTEGAANFAIWQFVQMRVSFPVWDLGGGGFFA